MLQILLIAQSMISFLHSKLARLSWQIAISIPRLPVMLLAKCIVNGYEAIVDEFGLTVMDATLPIPEQQRRMRKIIRPYLQGVRRIRSSAQESAWAGLAREMRPSHMDTHEQRQSSR